MLRGRSASTNAPSRPAQDCQNAAVPDFPLAPSFDALVTDHLALVAHIVRETMTRVPSHVDRDDLTSAGLTALVKAAHAFEPERGVPFTAYAATRIRGGIVDELRSIDWASRAVRRRGREVEEMRGRLASALGRAATDAETASALGITLTELQSNQDDITRANVLSLHVAPDDEDALESLLVSPEPGPEAALEHRERLEYLVSAIEELPERQRIVITDYFLAEKPMAEIAETLGVSESRVSQIRAEALVLLRDAINAALDPALLPVAERPDGCASRRRETYFRAVAERHAERRHRSGPLDVSV
jgi:RNA polymerase sigma factor for flagellar operon FliA